MLTSQSRASQMRFSLCFDQDQLTMKYHATTFAVLASAIVFYVAGWNDGGAALLAAGGLLELVFWSRILFGSSASSKQKPTP